MNPLDLINQLARQEQNLAGSSFIAPVVPGGAVRLRVNGLVYTFAVRVRDPQWALLRTDDLRTARVVGTPSKAQIRQYAEQLPRLRVLLLEYWDGVRYGLQYSTGSKGLELEGVVPVQLSDNLDVFDVANCCFDGANVWCDSRDDSSSAQRGRQLRNELANMTPPETMRVATSTVTDRLAYKMLWLRRRPLVQVNALDTDDHTRLGRALQAGGASLESFNMRGDDVNVRFRYDGRVHNAQVDRRSFTVTSAGFCLAGGDRNFDLTSLVGVLRERDGHYDD